MAFRRQFVAHVSGDTVFHEDIAAGKRHLRKARRLERSLDVHLEIYDVGHKLRVSLRLVPSAHDPERHAHLILLQKRWNDRVQRALAPGQRIG